MYVNTKNKKKIMTKKVQLITANNCQHRHIPSA